MTAPLPPCPLCGSAVPTYETHPNDWIVHCHRAMHQLTVRGDTREEVESAWRRLAAPFEILRRAKWESCGLPVLYLTATDALALKKSVEGTK